VSKSNFALSAGPDPSQERPLSARAINSQHHPSQSSVAFGGGNVPTEAQKAIPQNHVSQSSVKLTGVEEKPTVTADFDRAAVEAEVARLGKEIEIAIDEIDNNFKLAGPEKRLKRRELNKL